MADIEKVIKGLECHRIDNNHRINCTDCPYYVDDDNHIRCVNDLHDDTIALQKEQEAVKPFIQISEHTGRKWLTCGACEYTIASEKESWDEINFCPKCGKPILLEGR